MCIVFYRVFKSDLWSYMVNTDLLPATPSSWVLSCVVFLLGDNRTNSIDIIILGESHQSLRTCQYFEKVIRKIIIIIRLVTPTGGA